MIPAPRSLIAIEMLKARRKKAFTPRRGTRRVSSPSIPSKRGDLGKRQQPKMTAVPLKSLRSKEMEEDDIEMWRIEREKRRKGVISQKDYY